MSYDSRTREDTHDCPNHNHEPAKQPRHKALVEDDDAISFVARTEEDDFSTDLLSTFASDDEIGSDSDQSICGSIQHEISARDDADNVDETEENEVDFILVWEKPTGRALDSETEDDGKRNKFEDNLRQQGLVLNKHIHGNFCFVTIYGPRHVLLRYADIMKLRMPLKTLDSSNDGPNQITNTTTIFMKTAKTIIQLVKGRTPSPMNTAQKTVQKNYLTAEYVKAKHYLFNEQHSEFLSAPTRSLIVDFILSRQSYSSDTQDLHSIGVERLIEEGVYKAAYPLHDGDWSGKNEKGKHSRYTLYEEWAKLNNWFKPQPADQIKDYLGVKCAFYFVWLGFYTRMLVLASVLGFLVILLGLFTQHSDTLSRDICNKTLDIVMCPECDGDCDYWKLSDFCTTAKLTYLFDNTFSIVFAFLMSIWAVLFLELWKRYSAEMTYRWDLSSFTLKAEHPRPNYIARVSHLWRTVTKLNSVTGAEEKTAPIYIKWPLRVLSFSVVLLFMSIALSVVMFLVLWRISLGTMLTKYHDRDWMNKWGIYIIKFSGISINLVSISILNYIFDKLSIYMTELEYMRTQTEFDESLTIKKYLFQFSNYYAAIFYIAFFKGKFVGYPGNYTRIFGSRQEECLPGGCLWELFNYLAYFMIIKQLMNAFMENLMPFVWKIYKVYRITGSSGVHDTVVPEEIVVELETIQNNNNKSGVEPCVEVEEKQKTPSTAKTILKRTASAISAEFRTSTTSPCSPQWLEDLKLNEWGTRELFPEYLEMIVQYGFVVLFIIAFPLAPLLALINNIFEIRLDAQKFLKYYRRPVPHRATNIGIWYEILDVVAQFGVISNAIIIAFTSNFIPRMVYRYGFSEDGSDEGFLNHTLAYFNTSDFQLSERPVVTMFNVTICRYPAYRNPPWAVDSHFKYQLSPAFWMILVARLVFIIFFQAVVSLTMNILKWLIPDIPSELKKQMKREEYLISELIIDQETKRAAMRQAQHETRRRNRTNDNTYPTSASSYEASAT
ncbi:hypothetical protein WDU94_014186 [Cyamophila willieti]